MMTKRSRRNHGAAFKAKVAFEAIKEQQTLSELSEHFQVHRNLITKWKKQLVDRAEEIFAEEKASCNDSVVQELNAEIGRLTMENEVLSVALGRIRGYKRKKLIQRDHKLPIFRQCQILGIARSSVYVKPVLEVNRNQGIKQLIREINNISPSFGSRRICEVLEARGHKIGRCAVRTLMRKMNIRAVYP